MYIYPGVGWSRLDVYVKEKVASPGPFIGGVEEVGAFLMKTRLSLKFSAWKGFFLIPSPGYNDRSLGLPRESIVNFSHPNLCHHSNGIVNS